MSQERGIRCGCGFPVARKTGWTERNPGRRFMSCKFFEPDSERRGCEFFQWIDEDMTEWQRHLTNKLILEKKLLDVQLNASQAEVKELESQKKLLLNENNNLKQKCKSLKAEMKLSRKKGNNRVGWSMCVCVVVLFLVFAGVTVVN